MLAVMACGCSGFGEEAEPSIPPVGHVSASLGEPVQGYPSYAERVVLYWTNRIRVDPMPFHDRYRYSDRPRDAQDPLAYDRDHARAARWQAEHVATTACPLCGDHSSCCEIGESGDGYACSSEVTSCGVTDWRSRIQLIAGKRPNGENAHQGFRTPGMAINAWVTSGGHWDNMTRGDHTHLGTGSFVTGRLDSAWVQVFARRRSAPRPVVSVGAHFPEIIRERQSGGAYRLYAEHEERTFGVVYHKPDGGPPQRARLAIDGECHDLRLAYGEAQRGAYETRLTLTEACQRYVFYVTDSEGELHTLPSTGSYGASLETEGCPDYEPTRPSDDCGPAGVSSPAPGDDAGIHPEDTGDVPGDRRSDGGGMGPADVDGSPSNQGSSPGDAGLGDPREPSSVGTSELHGSCAAMSPSTRGSPRFGLFMTIALAAGLWLRGRRRRPRKIALRGTPR
jgi:hypothetical protein